jgi:putative phosphoesterase
MLIGILSDTHDQVLRTKEAVATMVAHGAQALIHCGDITIAEVVYECSIQPAFFVFGNCDFDRTGLRLAIDRIGGTCLEQGGLISLGERRIAITHGHSDSEVRRLADLEPEYLFFGHSHRTTDVQKGPTRWINPGALQRANPWTIALLNLATNHLSVLPISDTKMHH